MHTLDGRAQGELGVSSRHQCRRRTDGNLISRRDFWRGIASLTPLAFGVGEGEIKTSVKPEFPVRLAKAINNSYLLDVAPDSTKLLLYYTRHPLRSFSWNRQWRETTPPGRNRDSLRIVNVGTWTEGPAVDLPALAFDGSFFGDGQAVYAHVPGAGGGRTLNVVLDLRTGKRDDQFAQFNPDQPSFSYEALQAGALLGVVTNGRINRTDFLTRVEWPSYKEIRRVPFVENRKPNSGRTETPVAISANRKTIAYGVDDVVVCRRSDDLEAVWIRRHPMEADSRPLSAGISADGLLVALAEGNMPWTEATKRCFITLFHGRDGAQLARFPVDGTEGVAISPDKKLLAAGQRKILRGGKDTQPTVLLIDIASGRTLAEIVQGKFRDSSRDFLVAGFAKRGIQFTPDGRYLITSGLDTKIWGVGQTARA